MCITLFCIFLCRRCTTTTLKCLISRFSEGRKQAITKFSFSLWTWISLLAEVSQDEAKMRERRETSLLSLIFASSWETSASRENLDMVDRNSGPEEFACIWQSKWVGIITIETEKMWVHSSCDVFVVVSCRGILNSLIFTKAWSMQAWIPVVSSSLYFWKSVFSFRVDSGCLYTRLLSKT